MVCSQIKSEILRKKLKNDKLATIFIQTLKELEIQEYGIDSTIWSVTVLASIKLALKVTHKNLLTKNESERRHIWQICSFFYTSLICQQS